VSEPDDTIGAYNQGAAEFAARFESLSAGDLWAPISEFIPATGRRLGLDIGAGVGHDAAWLASLGWEMVAVEPSAGLRAIGEAQHPHIRWLDDRLPDLSKVHRLAVSFDLVLLSAVWQHIRPPDRRRAFRKLVTLLKPGGVTLLSLRHGPGAADGRAWFPVSLGEIEGLARDFGLNLIRAARQPDLLGRDGVEWTLVCLRLPDDGSVGLPLIRGVILNDSKSSTYKLGLLRSVAKIADVAPALALADPSADDDRVIVPLGLVALNWLRNYLPLVAARLPQAPGNAGPDGLGFAGPGFRQLMDQGVSAQDLRIGATFAPDRAAALARALREAADNILSNPANYTTFPNSRAQIFRQSGAIERARGPAAALSPEYLALWGGLSVPGPLWRTMQRLGAWIEPLLLAEWARMMRDYGERLGRLIEPGGAEAHLIWQEPDRDTSLARTVARGLAEAGIPINCVWSGERLDINSLDVDHALPWSAWPCGDLWNLAPAKRSVNQRQKRDGLPSAYALAGARDTFLDWWEKAWLANPALAERFAAEARAALPIEREASPDAVFSGMEWRRLRVEHDQQPPLWAGLKVIGQLGG
jgi:SAM-dependent methyltransferase